MFSARILPTLLFGVLTFPASAALTTEQSLVAQLTDLLNSQRIGSADFPVVRSVKILTPADKLEPLCTQPVLSLTGNDTRLTGNRSVTVRCGKQKRFIQIAVQAEGTWWTTVAPLKAGATLTLADIERHHGSLEHLPAGLLFTPNEIVGRVTTRSVAAGSPVTENVLRQQWRVRSGEEVDVVVTGEGFTIHARGKALDNAAVNEKLRVALPSRQVAAGTVTADGAVIIDLQE